MIKKTSRIKSNSGFVALISAVILSVILLLIVTNLSFTGFYSRSNVLDYELKEKSYHLAEACVDTAILKLVNNKDYVLDVALDHNVPVGANFCDIYSIDPPPVRTGDITIITKANYNNIYFTTLKIVVSSSDMSVVSWEEI